MSEWAWLLILAMYLYLFQWLRETKKDVLRAIQDAQKDLVAAMERSGR